jgi:hypothetical protein
VKNNIKKDIFTYVKMPTYIFPTTHVQSLNLDSDPYPTTQYRNILYMYGTLLLNIFYNQGGNKNPEK